MTPARPSRSARTPVYQPAKPVPRSLKFLVFLLLAVSLAWLALTKHPKVREYRLYLFEKRSPVILPLSEFSENWTERDLRARFGEVTRCGDAPGAVALPDVHGCGVDVGSLNGVPAMYINFYFAKGKMVKAAVAIPWWRHAAGLNMVQSAYGPPVATQDRIRNGVRLHGWKLDNGAFIVYNRDMPFSPFEVNSIQWMSSNACGGQPCIR